MFFLKKSPRKEKVELVQLHGVFHKRLSLFQGASLIIAGTIGAGVLGIPYAISKIGLVPGIIYILILGLLMMGLNLMVGELSARTNGNMQLVGLARIYLGKWGERFMAVPSSLFPYPHGYPKKSRG